MIPLSFVVSRTARRRAEVCVWMYQWFMYQWCVYQSCVYQCSSDREPAMYMAASKVKM